MKKPTELLIENCKIIISNKNCYHCGIRCTRDSCPLVFEIKSMDCASTFGHFNDENNKKPLVWFKKWLKKYTSIQYEFDF